VTNGRGGVGVHVDEVDEPSRTKGCGGRSSGGEWPGLSMPFVAMGRWEVVNHRRVAADDGEESFRVTSPE
jgi:hypothetical protein